MKRRVIGPVVVALIGMSLHLGMLATAEPTVWDVDLRRAPQDSDIVAAVSGWQITPRGLAAPPIRSHEKTETTEADGPPPDPEQDASIPRMALTIPKRRFERIQISLTTTAEGRGNVRAVILDEDSSITERRIVGEPLPDTPWRIQVGRSEVAVDATALVSSDGTADLTPLWNDARPILIVIEAEPGASGVLVAGLRAELTVQTGSLLLIPVFWIMIGAAGFLGLSVSRGTWYYSLAQIIPVGLAATAALKPHWILEWSLVPVVACLLLSCGCAVRPRLQSAAIFLLLTIVIFGGALLRTDRLNEVAGSPLDPDAVEFVRIAEQTRWFYDSEYREPLNILFIKVTRWFCSDGAMAARMVSLLASLLLIPVVYYAGQEMFDRPAGLVAAALTAGSEQWVTQSVRGLRLELYSVALVLLTAWIFGRQSRAGKTSFGRIAAVAVAVCLVRLTSFWAVLIGLLWWARYQDRGWQKTGFIVGLMVAAVLPFLIRCGSQYGDPFMACNQHLRFYRNQEFRDQPGFPTSAELAVDPYAGEPTSTVDYFIRQHSVGELVKRTLQQWGSLFFGDNLRSLTCGDNLILYGWALLALAAVAVAPDRTLIVWMLLLIGPIVWLYSERSGPEWRLIFHISPLVYLLMGRCVSFLRLLKPAA